MTEQEAIETAERVVSRIAMGVPMHREAHGAEVRALAAAYVLMRDAAAAGAEALQDAHQRAIE